MKRLQQAFKRWKAKHWDRDYFVKTDPVLWLGSDTPPLRAFWEKHGQHLKKFGMWLLALIAGGVITKMVGLA